MPAKTKGILKINNNPGHIDGANFRRDSAPLPPHAMNAAQQEQHSDSAMAVFQILETFFALNLAWPR